MKKFALLVAASSLLTFGCAPQSQQKPMYYWNDYSHSLYNLKKEPTEETTQTHLATLNKIIEDSNTNTTRVPPGIYAELGYFLMNKGQSQEAVKYFNLEKETYPESGVLMARLIDAASSNKN